MLRTVDIVSPAGHTWRYLSTYTPGLESRCGRSMDCYSCLRCDACSSLYVYTANELKNANKVDDGKLLDSAASYPTWYSYDMERKSSNPKKTCTGEKRDQFTGKLIEGGA